MTVFAASLTSADVWMIVAIVVILLVLALLSVAETGLTRITRTRADALAERSTKAGRALRRLAQHPEQFINPVLLTVTALQTMQAVLTGIVADRLFGVLGVIVASVLNVIVFFVLAEALPKTWALIKPDRAALLAARPVGVLVRFPPLRWMSRLLIGLTNWIVPGKGVKDGPFVSEQELLALAEAAAEDEVIEHEERELIESVIEFGDTVAREVMVPRPDMVTVPAKATLTEALDIALEHGYSRLPVIDAGVDDVVGIAYTKDLLKAEREGRGTLAVADVARPARFVPETKQVRPLMRAMQTEKFHMAILVDEYGGTAGLVTLEDLIEELVGDIVDEYDVEPPDIERVSDDELLVQGTCGIDDLSDALGVELPDEDWDTAGGFLFGLLGHVPDAGEAADHEGWRFTVDQVDGRRIALMRITRVPGWEPSFDEED